MQYLRHSLVQLYEMIVMCMQSCNLFLDDDWDSEHFPFKFWLSPFTELLAGYHTSNCHKWGIILKLHPSAFQQQLNRYRIFEIQASGIQFSNFRGEEFWALKCWKVSNLICDLTTFPAPYLCIDETDCNEWHVVGKKTLWLFNYMTFDTQN